MTKANEKELIKVAVLAWLAVESPIRAVRELAEEIGLNLTNQQQGDILIKAMAQTK